MEETKKEQRLELLHQSATFKMVIPLEVERKIRLLCREIHNVEWSGVLFYKVSGSFEDKSLTITCVDIFQMDEGTGGYTEYDMSPDVCSYMCDHPELMETGIYQGLIHSHNNMATFFSGTDTATLLSEGSDMNHFVSLIVNNAGKYTAGITRRTKVKQTVNEEFSYPTWGDERLSGNRVFTVEKECVQWFNLDIEIERVSNDFEDEMLARIEEIRTSKASRRWEDFRSKGTVVDLNDKTPYKPKIESQEVKAGPANIAKPVEPQLPFHEDDTLDYEHIQPDPTIVDWMLKQTLTCSVIIPSLSKVDAERWAASLDKVYKQRFGTVKEFSAFASNFLDFLVNNASDPTLDDTLDPVEVSSVLAYHVRQELTKLPESEWLDEWIKLYDDYIY